MKFYIGISEPSHAQHVGPCMLSVNRLRKRRSGFRVGEWMMDSGAFTSVVRDRGYSEGVSEYARQIRRFAGNGELQCAVSQDFMCEGVALRATGLSVAEHQELTIVRFRQLCAEDTGGVYVLPVIQGYEPCTYADHAVAYGEALAPDAWVGVGSVCKRNGRPCEVAAVLRAVKAVRPDLRLHGFGLKQTALEVREVRDLLYSADSMAWSFAARMQGRDGNDVGEAQRYQSRLRELVAD